MYIGLLIVSLVLCYRNHSRTVVNSRFRQHPHSHKSKVAEIGGKYIEIAKIEICG